MQYVIFGANGYIGLYLYRRLVDDNYCVFGTSHKKQEEGALFFYDIQKSTINHILEKMDNGEDRTAIICIAEPKIDSCFENYKQAYDINVIKTKELMHQLSQEGFHSIYFSTDNVFDGKKGNYTEESPTNPINKYGMMKAEMEKYILEEEPSACILRISKVVSAYKAKQNIFTEWMNQIETGIVQCISGNYLSFVSIEDIYQVCLIVAKKKLQGLYNIVGDEKYSRAELAHKLFNVVGAREVVIEECELDKFVFKDGRPLNISMSNLKFKTETGYQFMSMDEVIKQFCCNVKGSRRWRTM